MPANPPPESIEQLLSRARELPGRMLSELAEDVGRKLPTHTRSHKGIVGQLLEEWLGADAGSKDEPDFLALGVELKTLPITGGKPKESTFVCTLRLNEISETSFRDSLVWRKLRQVLWVPVQADKEVPVPARVVGLPVLFSPTEEERATLQNDYERVGAIIAESRLDELDARLGTWLQVRPKAAHGGVRAKAPSAEGGYEWTTPRGFYLRTQFTERVLARIRTGHAVLS